MGCLFDLRVRSFFSVINLYGGVIISHVKTQTAIVWRIIYGQNNTKTRLVFKVKAPTASVYALFGG